MYKCYSSKKWDKYLVDSDRLYEGFQSVYRFPNGYGASVVCYAGSHGGKDGLFELAVIKFK